MEYWANILGMAGAACIAVAFIDGSFYAFMCGLLMAYTGYRLWRATTRIAGGLLKPYKGILPASA